MKSAAKRAPVATPGLSVRPRGVAAVRNDTSVARVIDELNRTFDEFKASNDNRIKDLEKKMGADPLNEGKVNSINAEITSLKNMMDDMNKLIAAARVGAAGNDNVTPERRAYNKAFNQWFRRGDRAIDAGADLHQMAVKAAMTTDSDPDGGYVVPTEMAGTIDRILGVTSAMRGLATVLSISAPTYKKLINMGGATSGWVAERGSRPETNTPQLRELEFNAMELYANPAITQTALDDAAMDLGAWLGNEVAVEFAEQEGEAFITGNGVGKPRGILSYDKVANASYAWGKTGFVISGHASAFPAATTSVSPADCLISLLYALKQGYRNGAAFLMSDTTMETVRKFKDADGAYIWRTPTEAEGVPTILGKPVYTDDNMDTVGANAYPIAVANFSRAYLIVDRVGVRVLRDPFTNKPYIHFYTTKRVGGGIQNFEAIKLLKIASS